MTQENTPALLIRARPDYVSAAAKFMSSEETRYYLNGVYFEPCAQGGVIVVATDGAAMIVLHDAAGFASRPAIIAFQKAFISSLKTEVRLRRFVNEAIKVEVAAVEGVTFLNSVRLTPDPFDPENLVIRHVAEIDGRFPNWRSIVPAEREGATDRVPVIAPKLLKRVADAATEMIDKTLMGSGVTYSFGGPGEPVVATSPAFGAGFVVITPFAEGAADEIRAEHAWRGAPAFMAAQA